jgi:rare lipoprotein A
MSRIGGRSSGPNRALPDWPYVPLAGVCKAMRIALALATVGLAACAQSSGFADKSALAPSRQASSEIRTKTSFVGNKNVTSAATRPARPATDEHAKKTSDASHGLASFYGSDSQTASGEKFDAREFTAAHRTLPFGTRVRVTNHSNGRSVVVTINDRGPFVHGRVIDVTPAAAHALGMSGLAPVTVERE